MNYDYSLVSDGWILTTTKFQRRMREKYLKHYFLHNSWAGQHLCRLVFLLIFLHF